MSNKLFINKTKFISNGNSAYGFTICDDYGSTYIDTLSKKEYEKLTDEKEIFRYIIKYNREDIDEFFINGVKYFSSIVINNNHHETEDFERIISEKKTNNSFWEV